MSNKIYVNADIKTKEDFFQRMKNGEEFFYGCIYSHRCYYNKTLLKFIKESLDINFNKECFIINIDNPNINLNLLHIEKTL